MWQLIVAAVGVVATGCGATVRATIPGIRAAARRSCCIHALPVDLCRREGGDVALDTAHGGHLLREEAHHHLVDLLRADLIGGVNAIALGGGGEVEVADAVELHRTPSTRYFTIESLSERSTASTSAGATVEAWAMSSQNCLVVTARPCSTL